MGLFNSAIAQCNNESLQIIIKTLDIAVNKLHNDYIDREIVLSHL